MKINHSGQKILILDGHKELSKKEYGSIPYSRIKRAKTSSQAFEKIIKITDRISIRFARTSSIKKLGTDDLIQEGRLIAWSCVNKYNNEMDSSFTTFFTTCLLHRFDKIRKRERAQKRTIDRKSESIFRVIDQKSTLIDTIVDESQDNKLKKKIDRIYLKQIINLLNPTGQQICKYLLNDMSISEIAKELQVSNSKVRSMFKKNVVSQINEIKKLDIL